MNRVTDCVRCSSSSSCYRLRSWRGSLRSESGFVSDDAVVSILTPALFDVRHGSDLVALSTEAGTRADRTQVESGFTASAEHNGSD
jgi:hypothetical protein